MTERSALIVVARVVLVFGSCHKTGVAAKAGFIPFVALLVLADAFSRVLTYYMAEENGCVKPARLQAIPPGVRKDWRHMRSTLLAYLSRDNLFVGFNVTWTLTALQLAADATRVVDIGLEFAYQRLCCQLTQRYKRVFDMLVPKLCAAFNCCCPAVLYADLELMSNCRDDIFRDTLYTPAVCQVI